MHENDDVKRHLSACSICRMIQKSTTGLCKNDVKFVVCLQVHTVPCSSVLTAILLALLFIKNLGVYFINIKFIFF